MLKDLQNPQRRHLLFVFCLVTFSLLTSYARVYVFGGDFTEDREAPFINLIRSAQEGDTIRMAAYKFTDEPIMDALIDAANRGAIVHLLKEKEIWVRPGSSKAEDGGADPATYLKHDNITVSYTPSYFLQQHAKFIAVTQKSGLTQAIISTANFCDMDDAQVRHNHLPVYHDFAIDVESKDAPSLLMVFDADMQGIPIKASAPTFESPVSIVWGPDHQRTTFSKMIEESTRQIDIYQQDLQDEDIADKLARAAQRGVKVRILMVEKPFGDRHGNKNLPNQTKLVKAGAQVNFVDPDSNRHLYIHAKVMVVDGKMYMGSCNMYQPSIDKTRELGVLTKDPEDIRTVLKDFETEWTYGKPLIVS